MSAVRFFNIKNQSPAMMKALLDYLISSSKTDGGTLVKGRGCFPQDAARSMMGVKKAYNKTLGRQFITLGFTPTSSLRKPLPRDFHGYFITYNQMAAFAEKHGLETKGIDSCLMHMWDCVQNFSAVFEKENPKKWFSEEEQAWYRLYRTMLKTQQMVKKRDEAVLAPLEVYQSIEIYGAGRIAQAIYRRLSTQGIRVTGFWVSDRTNNPEELFGLPVRVISDYTDQPAGCAMLVAVAKQWHEEIADHLKQLHICFYSYAANHLAGPYGVSCEERK